MVEKMTYKRLSEKGVKSRELKVIRLYQSNYPIPIIMKEVNLSKSMVNLILQKYHISRTRLPRIPFQKQMRVIELYKKGVSYPDISKIVKVNKDMVYVILKRYNVPRDRRPYEWSTLPKKQDHKLKMFIKNIWGDSKNNEGDSNE